MRREPVINLHDNPDRWWSGPLRMAICVVAVFALAAWLWLI